jgi:hypothetical protein
MADPADLQVISGRLERGEIDSAQFLDQLMRFVAAQIGCTRAGLRLFVDTEQGRTLRCVAMFDANLDRMVAAPDISHAPDSLYIEQLQRDGSVTVTCAPGDVLNNGPLGEYLAATQVASLMDMGFSVNGVLFGSFTCEQLGTPVDWSQRQLQSLRKIASRASLTLMHVLSSSLDTAPGALWETSTPNRLATMPMPLDDPAKP